MATSYTASDTARLLGVSVATVRRIADEMAEILPDYQPIPGKARRLSRADVLTISALSTRLQADTTLTRSALLAELSAPGSEPLVIPETLPTPEPDTPQKAIESPETSQAIQTTSPLPQNALAPFLQAHADTQRQIEKLSAQLAEIRQERPQERQAERRYPTAVIICFVLLLTGVTFSALLSDSRAALAMSFVALVVIAVTLIWPQVRR
jgi:hypothetical protein